MRCVENTELRLHTFVRRQSQQCQDSQTSETMSKSVPKISHVSQNLYNTTVKTEMETIGWTTKILLPSKGFQI